MSLIGTLDVALRGDTGNLDKALDKSSKKVTDFSEKVKGGGSGGLSSSAFASLGGAALGAAGKIAEFVSNAMHNIEELSLSASMLGTTTTALAGLQYGAELAGVSTEQLTHNLQHFARFMSEAQAGNAEVGKSLAMIGLRAQDLKDLPLDQQIGKWTDAMNKYGTQGDKIQRLQESMGKGSAQLVNVLKGGSEAIAKFTERAKATGYAVSGEHAAQVAEATQTWREFKLILEGGARTLAVILAPALKMLTTDLNQLVGGTGAAMVNQIKFAQALVTSIAEIGKTIFEVIPGMASVMRLIADATSKSDNAFKDWQINILGAVWTVQFGVQRMADAIGVFFLRMELAALKLLNSFEDCFTAVGKAWGAMFDAFKSGDFGGVVEKVQAAFAEGMKPNTAAEKALDARIKATEDVMKDDLAGFLQQKFAEFLKPAKPDVAPGKGQEQFTVGKKPAAMELGSKEAFSAIYGTEDSQKKALNVANDQLKENKKATNLLNEIVKKNFGLRRANM